jgi:hypothetical protein
MLSQIITNNEGRVVNLSSSDYAATAIDYFWYKGGEDVYVGYNVTINSGIWGISTEFDVKRPSASISTETTSTKFGWNENVNPHFCGMIFHQYNPEDKYGITFNRTNLNLNGAQGNTSWLQRINSSIRRIKISGNWNVINNINNVLDGGVVFSGNDNTFDEPQLSAEDDNIQGVDANDNFSMWLMFKSNTANSIYIPLAKVSWYWSPKLEKIPPWTSTDNHSTNPAGVSLNGDATDFPTWVGVQ